MNVNVKRGVKPTHPSAKTLVPTNVVSVIVTLVATEKSVNVMNRHKLMIVNVNKPTPPIQMLFVVMLVPVFVENVSATNEMYVPSLSIPDPISTEFSEFIVVVECLLPFFVLV